MGNAKWGMGSAEQLQHSALRITHCGQAGMTLIELLLALTLLAMVIGTALSFMRVAERARQRGEAEEEASRRARLVIERISQTLRSAVVPYKGSSGTYSFQGEAERLAFVTIAGPGGPREIRYLVEEDQESKTKQLIEEERIVPGIESFGQGDGDKRVLDRAVGKISFRYLQGGGEERWAERWEPRPVPPPSPGGEARPPRLPRSVEIRLSLTAQRDGKETLIELPPRVITLFTEL